MSKAICIYHGNCADGYGAAWAVRDAHRTFNLTHRSEDITYHPGVYQAPPPDVTGMDVIMVDFSYKSPILLDMASKAKSILILDHHKTAEADLLDIELRAPNVKTVFDMNRSGARITWDYYFKGSGIEMPRLIEVIEDRDLWRFKLGQDFTREIQACIFSFPYDFDIWDKLMNTDLNSMRRDGEVIERKHFKDIRELIAANMMWWQIDEYLIPVLNVPYMWTSDAGHIMWKEQKAPFAACYWDVPDGRVFSLRSKPEFDCSAIAAKFGGGGHKNAAGFKVKFDHPLARREPSAKGRIELPGDIQPPVSRN